MLPRALKGRPRSVFIKEREKKGKTGAHGENARAWRAQRASGGGQFWWCSGASGNWLRVHRAAYRATKNTSGVAGREQSD